jgi:multicomponent Na+:H+ antiporter subunit G
MTIIGIVLVAAGVAFLAISAIGVVHFPDFLSRAHAVAKSETLGIMLTLMGLVFLHRFGPGTPQLIVVIVIAGIANPTAVHALARAAAARSETVAREEAGGGAESPADPTREERP